MATVVGFFGIMAKKKPLRIEEALGNPEDYE